MDYVWIVNGGEKWEGWEWRELGMHDTRESRFGCYNILSCIRLAFKRFHSQASIFVMNTNIDIEKR